MTKGDKKMRISSLVLRNYKLSDVVAAVDDKVVGNVFIVGDFYPFVFRLAVKKEYRGKGIGKSLLDEAIRRLKKQGHKQVAL